MDKSFLWVVIFVVIGSIILWISLFSNLAQGVASWTTIPRSRRKWLNWVLLVLLVAAILYGYASYKLQNAPGSLSPVPTSIAKSTSTSTFFPPTSTPLPPIATSSPPTPSPTAISEAHFPYAANMSVVPITTDTWETANKNDSGSCSLANDTLTVTSFSGRFHICLNLNTHAMNLVLQSQLTINSGDCGGLVLRSGGSNSNVLYAYTICMDNTFRFVKHAGDTDQVVLANAAIPPSSRIVVGLDQTYSLAVVANGSTFTLYINDQQIYSGSDPDPSSRFTNSINTIGVLARGVTSAITSVSFSHVQIYVLTS